MSMKFSGRTELMRALAQLCDFVLGYTTDPTPNLSSDFTPFTVTAATTFEWIDAYIAGER